MIDNWESGIQNEIDFWTGVLGQYKNDPWRFDGTNQVHKTFGEVLERTAKRVGKNIGELKILDLGCGAYNGIGGMCGEEKLNVVHADYLADVYNQVLKEFNLDEYPFKPVFADMTDLKYKDGEFDVVHCLNTMDHCADALKAFEEVKRVAKYVVYTGHYRNVETMAPVGSKGLHRWNIDRDGESLIVWKPEGPRIVVEGFKAYDDPYPHLNGLVKVIGVLEK
jgi:ubiquinone/menaquinone biosynthesis C-methylase UbiE